jgi:hypothetical protein
MKSKLKAAISAFEKAEKARDLAKKRQTKIKDQKRPRKASLEKAKANLDAAEAALTETKTELAALTGTAAPAAAPRAENPDAPAEPSGLGPSSSVEAVREFIIAAIVDAHMAYQERLEQALELLEARIGNPHVRAYRRSEMVAAHERDGTHVRHYRRDPRVAAHERGDSRFFGTSSGYTESGR